MDAKLGFPRQGGQLLVGLLPKRREVLELALKFLNVGLQAYLFAIDLSLATRGIFFHFPPPIGYGFEGDLHGRLLRFRVHVVSPLKVH